MKFIHILDCKNSERCLHLFLKSPFKTYKECKQRDYFLQLDLSKKIIGVILVILGVIGVFIPIPIVPFFILVVSASAF